MKNTSLLLTLSAIVAVGLPIASAFAQQTPSNPTPDTVPKYVDIQKSFDKTCIKCHGDARAANGINLAKYESVIKGGSDGPVIVKGDPTKSPLYLAITATQGYGPMPPRGPKLADKEIKAIEAWIKSGAKK